MCINKHPPLPLSGCRRYHQLVSEREEGGRGGGRKGAAAGSADRPEFCCVTLSSAVPRPPKGCESGCLHSSQKVGVEGVIRVIGFPVLQGKAGNCTPNVMRFWREREREACVWLMRNHAFCFLFFFALHVSHVSVFACLWWYGGARGWTMPL